MSYAPPSAAPRPMVSIYTPRYAPDWPGVTTVASSAAWESPNRAVYFPIVLSAVHVVRRLWWVNGATVSASYNLDCGIYTSSDYAPGARIVSTGSTAQGTASQVQFVDITDIALAPGLYWIALTADTGSATVYRTLSSSSIDALMRMQEESALPLPATATPVESTTTNLYLFGFATTASP